LSDTLRSGIFPAEAMNDPEFDDLLRAARGDVSLPDSFRRDVWKRIETQEVSRPASWAERFFGAILRPAGAATMITFMVAIGLWAGALGGPDVPDVKVSYVESISPFHSPQHK
jgi:hypothetical protein